MDTPRLFDTYNRHIHKLRLQLTDACNFRCFYCMPSQIKFLPKSSLLSSNENFWRAKSGLEVDFVLGKGEAAVEVKGSRRVDNKDIRSLAAFIDEFKPKRARLVCGEKEERLHGKIRIFPWQRSLDLLWAGKVI